MQVVILNDGETFTDITGCVIADVGERTETEEIEEAIAEGLPVLAVDDLLRAAADAVRTWDSGGDLPGAMNDLRDQLARVGA